MVYRRPFRRSYRRPYRKTTRKYGKKKRFSSRKTFTKSTLTVGKINPQIISRTMYVKLPYSFEKAATISASSNQNYVFLGNSLVSEPSGVNYALANGDLWANGVTQWCSFFDKYRVLGSSLKLQIISNGSSDVIRAVLIAVPTTTQVTLDTVAAKVTELNALSTPDLMAWPGASWKMLSTSGNSNNMAWLKNFTKTKSILGVKDIRDNSQLIAELPNPDGTDGTILLSSSGNTSTSNPLVSWFFYLRVQNFANSNQSIRIFGKQKYYTELLNRNQYTQLLTTGIE